MHTFTFHYWAHLACTANKGPVQWWSMLCVGYWAHLTCTANKGPVQRWLMLCVGYWAHHTSLVLTSTEFQPACVELPTSKPSSKPTFPLLTPLSARPISSSCSHTGLAQQPECFPALTTHVQGQPGESNTGCRHPPASGERQVVCAHGNSSFLLLVMLPQLPHMLQTGIVCHFTWCS